MNKFIGMGRLTRTPDLRYTQSGTAMCRFSIAINRKFKKDEVDFINVVAWNKTAEFISQYFDKGNMIAIEGYVQTGSYEKDGQKVPTFDVVVENAYFCGSKEKGDTQTYKTESLGEEVTFEEGELPF